MVSGANYRDDCVVYLFQVFSFLLPHSVIPGGWRRGWVGLFGGFIWEFFNVALSLKLHILLSPSGTFEFVLAFPLLKQKDQLSAV